MGSYSNAGWLVSEPAVIVAPGHAVTRGTSPTGWHRCLQGCAEVLALHSMIQRTAKMLWAAILLHISFSHFSFSDSGVLCHTDLLVGHRERTGCWRCSGWEVEGKISKWWERIKASAAWYQVFSIWRNFAPVVKTQKEYPVWGIGTFLIVTPAQAYQDRVRYRAVSWPSFVLHYAT